MKTGPKPIPPYDRVMRRVVEDDNGCWIWTGIGDSNGYGQVQVRNGGSRPGRGYPAHRVVYEHDVGPIAEGYDLHHICKVRRCVNPKHLVPVDHAEHSKHHTTNECRKCGSSDWYVRKDNGIRQCRTCNRNQKRARAALKALLPRGNARHYNRDKTHCIHGHEFTEENTYIREDTGTQQCIACHNQRKRSAA